MMKKLSDYPDLLTSEETCDVLRVGKRTVSKLIAAKTLKARKIAGKWLITNASIKAYMDSFDSDTEDAAV